MPRCSDTLYKPALFLLSARQATKIEIFPQVSCLQGKHKPSACRIWPYGSALSAAEPTPLPSPCPAAPALFGLVRGLFVFCLVFLLLLFSSDGVKVHPIRHFIAAPDEKSPRDSRSRTAPGLESPRLASQPVPVPGGPGSPNDSSLFRRQLRHPGTKCFLVWWLRAQPAPCWHLGTEREQAMSNAAPPGAASRAGGLAARRERKRK